MIRNDVERTIVREEVAAFVEGGSESEPHFTHEDCLVRSAEHLHNRCACREWKASTIDRVVPAADVVEVDDEGGAPLVVGVLLLGDVRAQHPDLLWRTDDGADAVEGERLLQEVVVVEQTPSVHGEDCCG